MEIRHLRLIKTIVEQGNISSSADKLFLTKSAVSHQLREFEERLGLKIFLRSRNNWQLTQEGKTIYKLAKKVLTEIDTSIKDIESIREGSKGLIRINPECYSFYQGLPTFIQKMSILYPEIDIQLEIDTAQKPIQRLLNNELDITITTTRPTQDELSSIPLFDDEVFAIMNTGHELAKKPFIDPSDFLDIHLIIHSFPLESVSVYQSFLKQRNIRPQKITAIPLTEIAIEMVQANMGVTCMAKWAFKSIKLPEGIVFKKIGKSGFKRTHYLVIRKADNQKKYMQDFVQNIKEDFI